MPLDLTLPSHAPELGGWDNYNADDASFALYTLIPSDRDQLKEIADRLEKKWMQDSDYENTHLVRVAPNAEFTDRTLQDILEAHIALDKEVTPPQEGQAADGDIHWYARAFIVLVDEDWEDGEGLLFVYADDDEEDEFRLRSFRFKGREGYSFLSSLSFGDITLQEAEDNRDDDGVGEEGED